MKIGHLTLDEIVKFAEMDIKYADQLHSQKFDVSQDQANDMVAIIRWWLPMILADAKYELTNSDK